MHTQLIEQARAAFEQTYGDGPQVVAVAPGRVELLGNHTDYNDGLVMMSALDRAVAIAAKPRQDRTLRISSAALRRSAECNLDRLQLQEDQSWTAYLQGVADQLQQGGHSGPGADLMVTSNLPIGLGVSSSAALEVATGLALTALWGVAMDRKRLAQLCQRAENEFVGVGCGILDQFSALFGDASGAIFLDCRTLEHEVVPLPTEALAIVMADTGVRHSLVASQYNTRRQQCQQGVRFFHSRRAEVKALRDVTPTEIDVHSSEMDAVVLRRVRHVVEENARVLAGARALRDQRADCLWFIMRASHNSSRDLFENTCGELDLLVDLAYEHPGVVGARLSGGGFGGGTVNLVKKDQVEDFVHVVGEQYARLTETEPRMLVCEVGGAAYVV